MRIAGLEHPRDRIARPAGGVQRAGVVAQPCMGVDRVGARDGQQVAAAFVQLKINVRERLEAPAEPAARSPHALGDCPDASAHRRVDMQDPVGFAVAQRPQHHRFCAERTHYTL